MYLLLLVFKFALPAPNSTVDISQNILFLTYIFIFFTNYYIYIYILHFFKNLKYLYKYSLFEIKIISIFN